MKRKKNTQKMISKINLNLKGTDYLELRIYTAYLYYSLSKCNLKKKESTIKDLKNHFKNKLDWDIVEFVSQIKN